jgi:aspartate-semialdehyde dehydrogenase
MRRIGLIGWRGMVGSVLMQRMQAEKDLALFEPVYFSTSQIGQKGPSGQALEDAYDLGALGKLDIIVTCQGGDYTGEVYANLRKSGWKGYWIDAASTLRMRDDAIIVLDPVNRAVIDKGLKKGIVTYVGGNCTVSLMLMAMAGLFKANLVEWLSTMTYQAASGAGAKNMTELMQQMADLSAVAKPFLDNPAASALDLDAAVTKRLRSGKMPVDNFGAPLAASLIPWIDKPMENGQTREEWKGVAETNKILGTRKTIPVDGECVRVGAMRCHSQGLTIKLRQEVALDEITDMIKSAHEWVKVVPNTKEATLKELTPAAISGTLTCAIGRMRLMNIGPRYLTAFTVGDQLLWGAAEPIRRILRIVLEHLD